MHRFHLAGAFSLAVILAAASPAFAGRILVTIDGVRDAQGNVFVGLYSNPNDFLNGSHCDRYVKVRASTRPITVAFDNLNSGEYAVGAYHDENANGQLDLGPLGLPIEGYALSNGVRAVFAKPTFVEAAFTVGATENKPVALHIQY